MSAYEVKTLEFDPNPKTPRKVKFQTKYPFRELAERQSFKIPAYEKASSTVVAKSCYYWRQKLGFDFRCRKEKDGSILVWRNPDPI